MYKRQELPDELLGFAGYRAVKVDPVRSMGFKIADYQRGVRESRGLFTGGAESVLKGGAKTARDIVERFIAANKAKFNVDKEMLNNIRAANILGTDMDAIRLEFNERGLRNVYNRLDNDVFVPYFPSENIQREFRQIEERIGVDNPFDEARDVLLDIQDDLRDLSFDDIFEIDINEYLPSDPGFLGSMLQTDPVNPAVIQPVQQATLSQTGLTPSEQALLSPEEQAIKLRQRGLA